MTTINFIAHCSKNSGSKLTIYKKDINFFVSEQEILVHNFAIPLIGAAIAWLVENFVFTVGVSILGIGAGVVLSQADSKNEQKPQCDIYLQYENTSFSPDPEDPKDDEEHHKAKDHSIQ